MKQASKIFNYRSLNVTVIRKNMYLIFLNDCFQGNYQPILPGGRKFMCLLVLLGY